MANEMKTGRSTVAIDYMALFFSLMIIVNSTLELDVDLYVIPKALILIFFAVMAVFVILNVKNNEPLFCKSLIFPVLFFIWESLSILWAQDRVYAVFTWETQAQLFLLFLFIYYYIRTKGSVKTFLWATYLSGYALLVYTVYKYGFADILEIISNADRLGGEINNENVFGTVFASAALVAFYFVTKKMSKLHIVSVVVFSLFALASGSKKATLMIVFGILGISILAYGIRRIWKVLLILAVLIAAGYIVVKADLFPALVERFSSFLGGELNAGDYNRKIFREKGFELILHRPLFGYGLAGFAGASGIGVYSHDNFIEICVGSGIIGLVLYYIPWVYSVGVFLKDSFGKRGDNRILFVLLILYIVMGIGSVQYNLRGVWIFLAVMLAAIDKEKTGKK